jgi:outer membrane protein OmpA-like peptidoglycan-associated protein
MSMRKFVSGIIVAVLVVGLSGCASMSKTGQGAIIGGAAGTVIGGAIGHAAGNTLVGAIIGAAVGGAAGAFIGRYMDKQAEEIRRDIQGARVERVGEGIKITFDSGLLFDVDKSQLRPVSQENLVKLAAILNKYPDTNILIEGHTDSSGADDYNLRLSRERAQSVAGYLAVQQVASPRFTTQGYGEAQPIADNATAEGKQQNRRVDVAVMANDKLKKAAKDQIKGGA